MIERDPYSYLDHWALERMDLGEVKYPPEQKWGAKGIQARAPRRIMVEDASDPASSQQQN